MKRYGILGIVFIVLIGLMVWKNFKHSEDQLKAVSLHSEEGDAHLGDEHAEDHDHREEGEEHHDHEESEASVGGVGKKNAVIAADEHDGIQLSHTAIETIGLKTIPSSESGIPHSALVFYQDSIGIYRLRDGWLKLISVQFQQQDDAVTIVAADLQTGDHIVTEGMGLLRAAELDAFSGEVGHAH